MKRHLEKINTISKRKTKALNFIHPLHTQVLIAFVMSMIYHQQMLDVAYLSLQSSCLELLKSRHTCVQVPIISDFLHQPLWQGS